MTNNVLSSLWQEISKDLSAKDVSNAEWDRVREIAQITKAARARWRIENQCFNTLKNFGYELTHNWGHLKGESFNFYILIMLGRVISQIAITRNDQIR